MNIEIEKKIINEVLMLYQSCLIQGRGEYIKFPSKINLILIFKIRASILQNIKSAEIKTLLNVM